MDPSSVRDIGFGHPDPVVTQIIEARQPAHLTGRFFQHLDGLPMSWAEQEQLLLA